MTTTVVMCSQNLPVPDDRRVWREARTLARAGFYVTVIAPGGHGRPSRERLEGVDLVRYPPAPRAGGLAGMILETARSLAWTTAFVLRLRLRRRIDVLHAANPPDTFFLVGLLVRATGGRFVFDQHDACPELLVARTSARTPLVRGARLAFLALERASYRVASLVIAPNNSYRRLAVTRGKCPPTAVIVVRSGPDEGPPVASGRRRHDGPLDVVFAGVVGHQDRVDVLVDAAADVLRRRPGSLRVSIIGDGDAARDLTRHAQQVGIDDAIDWVGWVDGDEVPRRLANADVGVSLDGDDDFSRLSTMTKVGEYLAAGIPCIASDLPENRVTAGDAARYFPAGDAAALAKVFDDLLDDPQALDELAARARERGSRLTWHPGGERLVAAYRWLLFGGPVVAGDQHVA
jgi:glycosyltransferase involved in cell wall biosynthesis